MTLIEIMIVITIIAFASGGLVLSFRAVSRRSMLSNAGKLASAIRFVYDRAITTGGYYRMVLDLGTDEAPTTKYRAERSDERVYLVREKEITLGKGVAFDWDADQKRKDEDEKREKERTSGQGGLAGQELTPPPAPKRPRFQTFKDSMFPEVELKGCRIRDVFTPRQPEAYTSGKAYLYFFPDGHTESAVIHVVDSRDPTFVSTLVISPLTGRVEIKPGDVEVPRDFDEVDDEGQKVAPR